jgi:hypothetical protein
MRGFSVVILVFLVTILALVGAGSFYLFNKQQLAAINSFEECAKKYPVMESYPAQCNTPDGKHFVQDLREPINESTSSAKIDAQIWNDVGQRVVLVNLYYDKYQRLPVSLEEISTDPEFSYFRSNPNPIDGKPYSYSVSSDKKSFEISGVQNDGVLYKQVIEVD